MKTKRIKAVPYWINPAELMCRNGGIITPSKMFDDVPVFILPADAASYERMVEQFWNRCLRVYDAGGSMNQAVRAGFKEIGITQPKKGTK